MGYVGSVLVPYLASLGTYELYGFDAGYFEKDLTGPCPEYFLAKQYRGDLREFPKALLKNMDAVIHLGALSCDDLSAEIINQVNYQATVRLAELAKQAGVLRFVFASSCDLYGGAGDGVPRSEQDEINPLTLCSKSKALAEKALEKLASPDFQISTLRFATACGPSPRLRLDLALNFFIATAMTEQKITIQGDGSLMQAFIHVRDMARAMEWAVNRSGDDYLMLNVGSDLWNYALLELAQECADLIPGLLIERDLNNLKNLKTPASYQVDFKKFRELAPYHQPIKTMDQTVESLSRLCQPHQPKFYRGLGGFSADFKDALSPLKLTLA